MEQAEIWCLNCKVVAKHCYVTEKTCNSPWNSRHPTEAKSCQQGDSKNSFPRHSVFTTQCRCCTCCKSMGSSTLESGQQGPSSALPFVPCSTQRMLKSSSNFLWLNLLLLAMLPTWAIWRKGFTSLKAILVLHNLLLFVQTEQVIQARDFMSQLTSTGAQVGNASLCAIQAVPPGTASKAGDERAAPPRLSSTCTAAC